MLKEGGGGPLDSEAPGVKRRVLMSGDRTAEMAAKWGMEQDGDDWQQLYEMLDLVMEKMEHHAMVEMVLTCLKATVVRGWRGMRGLGRP